MRHLQTTYMPALDTVTIKEGAMSTNKEVS